MTDPGWGEMWAKDLFSLDNKTRLYHSSFFSLGNKEKEQSKGKNKGKTGKRTVILQYQ